MADHICVRPGAGFGLAGALRAIAVPGAQVPVALLGFNLGVEVGQIAVLAALLPIVLAVRRFDLLAACRDAGLHERGRSDRHRMVLRSAERLDMNLKHLAF